MYDLVFGASSTFLAFGTPSRSYSSYHPYSYSLFRAPTSTGVFNLAYLYAPTDTSVLDGGPSYKSQMIISADLTVIYCLTSWKNTENKPVLFKFTGTDYSVITNRMFLLNSGKASIYGTMQFDTNVYLNIMFAVEGIFHLLNSIRLSHLLPNDSSLRSNCH